MYSALLDVPTSKFINDDEVIRKDIKRLDAIIENGIITNLRV